MGKYGSYTIRGSFTSPYGSNFNIKRDTWALYLQDSWTINGRLTINAGVRTESEYIPALTNDLSLPGASAKPIQFGFGDKLAPRVGLVYDVFGDSNLKVFGSFGIYYDVMKLYMAEGAFGGFKWKTDYYTLDNPDWRLIGASNAIDDKASQGAGGTYKGTLDWRLPSWDSTDPSLKPVAQREISLGAEKKIAENISLSVRLVQKHLIRTIEDTGVQTPLGEFYYNTNPGFGYSLPISQGGKFDDKFWPCPKAKREYYGMNLALEKRFSNNWQGGVNYTLSRTAGNYGGLSSTDEVNRNSPNVERYYDLWFMAFDLQGNDLKGPLPQDRTHYIKAYGSYAFPFGLTVGVVAYSQKRHADNHGIAGQQHAGLLPEQPRRPRPRSVDDLGRPLRRVHAETGPDLRRLQRPGQQRHQHQDLAVVPGPAQQRLHADLGRRDPLQDVRLQSPSRRKLPQHRLQPAHLAVWQMVG